MAYRQYIRTLEKSFYVSTDQPEQDRFLTAAQVAEWLNVSTAWVRDHCTRKQPRLPLYASAALYGFVSPIFDASSQNMLAQINQHQVSCLLSKGRHMGRDRHQEGRVELVGKQTKKWRGHFYQYVLVDGTEVRKHKTVTLGLKSALRKWEAENKLQGIIQAETGNGKAKPDSSVTLAWFWENRYQPMKSGKWKRSTASKMTSLLKVHVLPAFGQMSLDQIDRFQLQTHLNKLADKDLSYSIVQKVHTHVKAILEEAVEQEFLTKNPARKLEIPKTKAKCERFLTVPELELLSVHLPTRRDRLIVRLCVLCALRPGELFALRLNDLTEGSLRIDESIWQGHCDTPKTDSSAASVVITESLQQELSWWSQSTQS